MAASNPERLLNFSHHPPTMQIRSCQFLTPNSSVDPSAPSHYIQSKIPTPALQDLHLPSSPFFTPTWKPLNLPTPLPPPYLCACHLFCLQSSSSPYTLWFQETQLNSGTPSPCLEGYHLCLEFHLFFSSILSAAMKASSLHRKKSEVDTVERNRDDFSEGGREKPRGQLLLFLNWSSSRVPFLLGGI